MKILCSLLFFLHLNFSFATTPPPFRELNKEIKLQQHYAELIQKKLTLENKSLSKDRIQIFDAYIKKISQNISMAITSYCIDADKKIGHLIQTDVTSREKTKDQNLKNLSIFDSDDSKNSDNSESAALLNWNECLGALAPICYNGILKDKNNKTIYDYRAINHNETSQIKSYDKNNNMDALDTTKDVVTYSQYRACSILNYIEGLKKSLNISIQVKKRLENDKAILFFNLETKKKKKIDSKLGNIGYENSDLDELVLITSSQINEIFKSKYDEEKFDKNNKIVSPLKLSKSTKEYNEAITASLDQIKNITENPLQMRLYFASQGLDDDEVDSIIKSKMGLAQIKKKFLKQKSALIDHFSSLKIGEQKNDPQSKQEVYSKDVEGFIEEYLDDLENSQEMITSIAHFNNIVSGFININNPYSTLAHKSFQTNLSFIEEVERPSTNHKNQNRLQDLKMAYEQRSMLDPTNIVPTTPLSLKTINSIIFQWPDDQKNINPKHLVEF